MSWFYRWSRKTYQMIAQEADDDANIQPNPDVGVEVAVTM